MVIIQWYTYVAALYMNFITSFLPLGLSSRRGIVVACVFPSVRPSVNPSVRKLYHVRTITCHRFELKSPNLHQTCILGYSRLLLRIGLIDLDLQGNFGHFDSEFLEIQLVCMITRHRFGLQSPNLHPGIFSACIENKGHWLWPSRSFWPFWLRILGNLACLCDNSS